MEGTLPVWIIILLFGGFLMFALGYCKLYVSKANREAVEDYRKRLKTEPPVVIIREHFSPYFYLNLTVLIIVAAAVAFFCQSYLPMLASFGGGFFKGALIVLIAFVLIPVFFAIVLSLHLIGETITAMSYEKLYQDRYGLEIKYETE
ncbi:hypothetical protein IJS18_02820 [Candidatus Saccharibacteria bacterium]|nr:hypothetical protein [Candidatus Saccharibacteria bacterium]